MNVILQYCRFTWLICLSGALLAAPSPLAAQDDPAKVHALLEKVQQAYRSASYLGFHVNYRYMNIGGSGKQLDTLSGEVEMDKNRSRYVIDRTETVTNGKYSIHIMHDNKLIYLSAPRQAGTMDPVAILDSALEHGNDIKATVAPGNGSAQVLTLHFPPGRPYTQVQMIVSRKTGFMESLVLDLHPEGIVGTEMIDRPGKPAPYNKDGRVEIQFSQYQQGKFGDEVFNDTNYFTRVGNRFEPAGAYKDYHIFLASSNL